MALRNPFARPNRPAQPTPAENAEKIIQRYTEAASLVGLPGAFAPHMDTLALAPMWALMIWRLARCHGVPLTPKGGLKIARAMVTTSIAFYAGIKTAGWLFSLTGFGIVPVAAMNATLNGALTYSAGHAVSKVFASTDGGGTGPMVAAIIDEFKKLMPKPPIGFARKALPATGLAAA